MEANYETGPAPSARFSPDMLLNGYVGASLVHAFGEFGIFETLSGPGPASVPTLAAACGAREQHLDALISAAASLGLVRRERHLVALTDLGRQVWPLAGYFTVTIGGYGDLFHSLGDLVTGRKTYGLDPVRDDRAVAKGCAQNHTHFCREILLRALADIPSARSPTSAAARPAASSTSAPPGQGHAAGGST